MSVSRGIFGVNDPVGIRGHIRTDIQVLRGLAVLVVMMYHAGFPLVENGYLGVDIFFVISGFLITRIILADIEKGCFSFREFYFRRARRLLPAAFTVFLFTALASAFFLSSPALWSLLAQLLASMTFMANIFFWQETNYFAGAADLMPLLHIWSLSLEEQFYFVLPLLLVKSGKSFRLKLLLMLAFASLLFCNWLVMHDAPAAFFLLPSRAWELLLGSILATGMMPVVTNKNAGNFLGVFCICLIILALAIDFGHEHPRYNAMAVCFSTFMLIWLNSGFLSCGIHVRAMAKVGDISYSLYLVHWPLMAIARNLWVDGEVPPIIYFMLFAISFPLAVVLYKFIEQPYRLRMQSRRRVLALLLPLMLVAIFLPVAASIYWSMALTQKNWALLRAPNFGFAPACDYKKPFFWNESCSNSEKPDVLVWGDSYAMHLVPGILNAIPGHGLAQATRNSCAPNLHIAQVNEMYNTSWAESCKVFNRSVIEYIRENRVGHVILAARFNRLEGDFLYDDGEVGRVDSEQLFATYAKTLDAVRKAGAEPLIVAPPPVDGSNVGECIERLATGRLFITSNLQSGCRISRPLAEQYQQKLVSLLLELESEKQVKIIWPSAVLCDAGHCEVELDGIPLYRDDGHYSIRGSQVLIPRLGISSVLGSNTLPAVGRDN